MCVVGSGGGLFSTTNITNTNTITTTTTTFKTPLTPLINCLDKLMSTTKDTKIH